MAVMCKVCNSQASKYKCSSCFLPYCSVPCYNTHKGSEDCKKVEKKVDAEEEKAREDAQRYFTEDMIQPEKLGQLGESECLKNLLKNPDLQSMLKAVDNAENAAEAMDKAMKDPTFVEFADECLKIVEDSDRSLI